MPRIHLLDDRLISQIAAGEVIERPASVVKELLENSIDAGASSVEVELEAGGKRRILVTDDGCGMDADDALLAFDRHATSKIRSFEDLEHVATLGFRGEALATIAAVARVELRTAVRAGDGHLVRVESGRVRRSEPVAHPRGTRVEVASLFYSVPARRKFLKRPQTELRRAVEVVQGYALAHPELRFTVFHEGRSLLETTPSPDDGEGLRERIRQVFGGALSSRLTEIPLDFVAEDEAISGFIGDRGSARGRRMLLYVNRRLVRDRILLARFYRAVRDEWRSEEYPSLFLFLDLPASEIDVNAHPQKSEVRFRDLAFIDRVEEALRTTLGLARGEEPAPLEAPSQRPVAAVWEGLGGEPYGGREPWKASADAAPGPLAAVSGEGRDPGTIAQAAFAPPAPLQVPLAGRSGRVRPFRLLGQYKGSLILLEGPDGLYIIDQHVAHERLLYERLRRALEGERATAQNLIEPQLLELSASEAMRIREMTPLLEGCGFALSPMSGNTVALTAIPTVLSIDQAEAMVQRLAASRGEVESDVAASRRRLLDALAASMACRGAVKIHHPMSMAEMQRLVSELFEAEQPYACPHGRPVVLQMGDVELERRFGRR